MASSYGKWIIDGNLSGGFQANTHLVKQNGNEKIYVLKVLKDTRMLHRFKTEIKAGIELKHPNILKIVDYDIDSKRPYLVSEYHSGGTLKNLDIQNTVILDKINIFLQICNAVGFAHSNKPQIIHRDLKPDNIFLKEDGKTPIVGDFGICFINDDGERVTLVDEAVGARKYTAPELENGRNDLITPSSDVYSLGKILYWMLAGRVFDRERHRESSWNLTEQGKEIAYIFIYELLDKMIVEQKDARLKDANEVAENVKEIIQKLKDKAHPLDFNAPQHCLYCGVGQYDKFFKVHYDGREQEYPFSFNQQHVRLDIDQWQSSKVILVCSNCGNEQVFRPFYKGWDNKLWKGYPPE